MKKYDVGVLFVHGIGTQNKSDTLGEYAESIFSWINDHTQLGIKRIPDELIAGSFDELEPRLRKAWHYAKQTQDPGWYLDKVKAYCDFQQNPTGINTLDQPEVSCGQPLCARIKMKPFKPEFGEAPDAAQITIDWVERCEKRKNVDWLFAEAHWANEFTPPTIKQLLAWSPRGIGMVAASVVASIPNSFRQKILRIVGPLLLVLGFPIIYFTLLLSSLAELIPIDSLKNLGINIRNILIGVIGDAFAFSQKPLEMNKVINRVKMDLDWLAMRCHKVLVVGHSQGAMIAYLACESRPNNVSALITLGAGIRKLGAMIATRRNQSYFEPIADKLLIGGSILGLASIGGLLSWLISDTSSELMMLTLLASSLVAWFIGAIVLVGHEQNYTALTLDDSLRLNILKGSDLQWTDIFSSHDPVPNGPISENRDHKVKLDLTWMPEPPVGYPNSIQITNFRSILFDHTSYLLNREECVARLVQQCALLSGHGLTKWIVPTQEFFTFASEERKRLFVRYKRSVRIQLVLLLGTVILGALTLIPIDNLNRIGDEVLNGSFWQELITFFSLLDPLFPLLVVLSFSGMVAARLGRSYSEQKLNLIAHCFGGRSEVFDIKEFNNLSGKKGESVAYLLGFILPSVIFAVTYFLFGGWISIWLTILSSGIGICAAVIRHMFLLSKCC